VCLGEYPRDAVEELDDIIALPAQWPLEVRDPDSSVLGLLGELLDVKRRGSWPGIQAAAH
jgi:hypothetical protein